MIARLINLYRLLFWPCEKYARKKGVKIGRDCNIQTRYFGSEPFLISIGNHVQITSGVKFFTHGGGWVLRETMPDFDSFGRIIILDNVYIGENSLILPGVTIESNVIVGAGSVVTKSVPSGWIVAGNPAVMVGQINQHSTKMQSKNFRTKFSRNKREAIESAPDNLFIEKPFMTL